MRAYLPKTITDRLSEDPPRLVDGSFVDPALRAHQSDLLFEVTLMTGTPVLVYALLEHKSTPDPLTPLQVEEYKLRIWRRRIDDHPDDTFRLPPILALVFYHGERPWTVPRSISEMIADDASIRALTRLPGYYLHHVGPDGVPELAAEPELRALFLALYLSQAKAAQAEVMRYTEIFAHL
ncbi:MAG: Rpn family recombination-promoting nuclease/putative transposase [Aestuariivita sp.]|nr:Rpn family recombination-promoting nuclease/putative transposase [Aestuariivita sp.]